MKWWNYIKEGERGKDKSEVTRVEENYELFLFLIGSNVKVCVENCGMEKRGRSFEYYYSRFHLTSSPFFFF